MLKKYIITFLVSMVPLIELRGAVPYGLSPYMGGSIPIVPLYILCIIGNMIPVPFIYFFARRILEWGSKKHWPKGLKWLGHIFKFFLKKGERGGKKLTEKVSEIIENNPNILALIEDNEVEHLSKEECLLLQKLIKLNLKMTTYEDREIFFLGARENYFYFKNLGLIKE